MIEGCCVYPLILSEAAVWDPQARAAEIQGGTKWLHEYADEITLEPHNVSASVFVNDVTPFTKAGDASWGPIDGVDDSYWGAGFVMVPVALRLFCR